MKTLPRTLSYEEQNALRILVTHPALWDLLQRRHEELKSVVGHVVLEPGSKLTRIPFDEYRNEARGIQYTRDFLDSILAACSSPAEAG